MLETIASHLDFIAGLAPAWKLVLVFTFMAVESSFIPFPSDIELQGLLVAGCGTIAAEFNELTHIVFCEFEGFIIGSETAVFDY